MENGERTTLSLARIATRDRLEKMAKHTRSMPDYQVLLLNEMLDEFGTASWRVRQERRAAQAEQQPQKPGIGPTAMPWPDREPS